MCIEIGLRWVRASLRGYGGAASSGREFFDIIALEPDWAARSTQSDSDWQSANVELFAVDMADLLAHDEPTEQFTIRVERGFQRAADWLDARPPDAFDCWRAKGRKAEIFIGGWMSNEQFDMVLPVQFLTACGRAGLPLHICTND